MCAYMYGYTYLRICMYGIKHFHMHTHLDTKCVCCIFYTKHTAVYVILNTEKYRS